MHVIRRVMQSFGRQAYHDLVFQIQGAGRDSAAHADMQYVSRVYCIVRRNGGRFREEPSLQVRI